MARRDSSSVDLLPLEVENAGRCHTLGVVCHVRGGDGRSLRYCRLAMAGLVATGRPLVERLHLAAVRFCRRYRRRLATASDACSLRNSLDHCAFSRTTNGGACLRNANVAYVNAIVYGKSTLQQSNKMQAEPTVHEQKSEVSPNISSAPMLVVIHDFSPQFVPELNRIVEAMQGVVGNRLAAAVVPRWHGMSSITSDRSIDRHYRDLLGAVEERLLHGWTHRSQSRFTPVSILTGNADELRGLSRATILEHLRCGQAEFAELTGEQAVGLIPPAWQLPICATDLASMGFVMRFRTMESCRKADCRVPLATWSWDWGRLGFISRGGELVGRWLKYRNRSAVPCIAIHPADVRRGLLPCIVRLVRQLVDAGHDSTTPGALMSQAVAVFEGVR